MGGEISEARYDQMGGVGGALTRHADRALEIAAVRSGTTPADVLTALTFLVTVDAAGRRGRRRITTSRLGDQQRTAVGVLVEQRLLVSGGDDHGQWLGVAHESLLTHWPPLAAALDDRTGALAAARAIEEAAAQWRRAGSPDSHLWEHDRLASAAAVLDTVNDPTAVPLDDDTLSFAAASRQRIERAARTQRRRRRSTITALTVLLVLAASVAALSAGLLQSAREGERRAIARDMLARSAVLVQSDPQTALRVARAAQHLYPTRAGENALFEMVHFQQYGSCQVN